MSTIIRDTFIKLHKSDVLKNLEEEIRERYKGYKVPLVALKTSSSVMKQLAAYEGASVAAKGLAAAVEKAVAKAEETTLPAEDLAVLAVENAEHIEGDVVAATQEADESLRKKTASKRGRKPKAETEALAKAAVDAKAGDEAATALVTKKMEESFVDLVDLLPPLPTKGDFDVDAIRGSAYFFS
jgi:DNA-directed RNA polymerase, mitochondrial